MPIFGQNGFENLSLFLYYFMNFPAVKSRYLVAFEASHIIRGSFHARCIFSLNFEKNSLLEVAWENTACIIRHLNSLLVQIKTRCLRFVA